VGSDRLVVHPGAGARAKRWSGPGFRRVADAWAGAGGEVAVLLGPAEEDDAGAWSAAGYEPSTRLSLRDAAGLMGSAPLWVGNDSGMSHLAAALGRRGAVLFGPTRPRRWGPLGSLATVVFPGRSVDAVSQEVLRLLRAPITSP
jgi:ADP-heptose:LPS heptosyltransferase